MTDVILLAVLAAFFALAVAFVRACERIIGPDVEAEPGPDVADTTRVAA